MGFISLEVGGVCASLFCVFSEACFRKWGLFSAGTWLPQTHGEFRVYTPLPSVRVSNITLFKCPSDDIVPFPEDTGPNIHDSLVFFLEHQPHVKRCEENPDISVTVI